MLALPSTNMNLALIFLNFSFIKNIAHHTYNTSGFGVILGAHQVRLETNTLDEFDFEFDGIMIKSTKDENKLLL